MAKELEFMGVPVTEAGDGKFKVSKSDQSKILESQGVTKEVRKLVEDADNAIAKEAIKFTGNQVLKTKKPCILELGTGGTKVAFTMKGETHARNVATGEQVISYGNFSIRKKGLVPKSMRDEELAEMSKQIEKVFKK